MLALIMDKADKCICKYPTRRRQTFFNLHQHNKLVLLVHLKLMQILKSVWAN